MQPFQILRRKSPYNDDPQAMEPTDERCQSHRQRRPPVRYGIKLMNMTEAIELEAAHKAKENQRSKYTLCMLIIVVYLILIYMYIYTYIYIYIYIYIYDFIEWIFIAL